MQKLLLSALLFIHGFIHLIGFTAGFGLSDIKGFSGKTIIPLSATATKVLAILWLLTFVLFLVAALGYILHRQWWWMFCAAAIVVSQLLIIIYWKDAKVGTIANLLLVLPVMFAYGSYRFFNTAVTETKAIVSTPTASESIVTEDMLVHLPIAVKTWLGNSGIVGKPMTSRVYLKQRGKMCIKPGGTWMEAEAEQYFNIEEPAFIWTVKVRMLPGVDMTGRDRFADGRGNMQIKVEGLYTFADGKGDEIDQGTMLRYLGEICWFPSAALQPYMQWREIDTHTAEATMNYKSKSVSAIFHFDEKGRLISTAARRYMGMGKDATLQDWYIPCTEWKAFEGVMVPVKGNATWKLKEGDYDYYQWEITDLRYNGQVPQQVKSIL